MRDIKFKYYIQHDECGYITSRIFTLKEIEIGMLKEWLEECRRYSVIAICEHTGLHDKNGKEIYEGDIFQYEYVIGKIIYHEEYSAFGHEVIKLLKVCGTQKGMQYGLTEEEMTVCEVIGNMFENGDLINDSK